MDQEQSDENGALQEGMGEIKNCDLQIAEASCHRGLTALCNAGGLGSLTSLIDHSRQIKVSIKKGKQVDRSWRQNFIDARSWRELDVLAKLEEPKAAIVSA